MLMIEASNIHIGNISGFRCDIFKMILSCFLAQRSKSVVFPLGEGVYFKAKSFC